MSYKNLKNREVYNKNYYIKNKCRIKKSNNKYYWNNREKLLLNQRDYYNKVKTTIKYKKRKYVYDRRYQIKNRSKLIIYDMKRYIKNLKSWTKIIPLKNKCPICKSTIYFCRNNTPKAVHFDHRNGKIGLKKIRPTRWLSNNPWSKENEIKWLKFNFGSLCLKCNRSLPTNKRKEFVKNLVKYVFGNQGEYLEYLNKMDKKS